MLGLIGHRLTFNYPDKKVITPVEKFKGSKICFLHQLEKFAYF